jgi:spore coat polysaccharide biosynthesis protein SpsF (cytidylyltransferase family)
MPDYAFNHIPAMGNNYVDGIGAEVLSFHTLTMIADNANEVAHLEHVTQYIWDNATDFTIATISAPTGLDYPDVRLDVDTYDDLAFLTKIIMATKPFDSPENLDLEQVLKIIVKKV